MKYLVDTCVLSELARRKPSSQVLGWFEGLQVVNPFESVKSAQSVIKGNLKI